MRLKWLLVPTLSFTLLACDRPVNRPQANSSDEESSQKYSAEIPNFDSDSTKEIKEQILINRIRASLMEDDRLALMVHDLDISEMDGVVTLRGKVKNNQRKILIEEKIANINGVTDVNNQLSVMRNY